MIIKILFLFASVLVKNIYSLEFSRKSYLNQQCKILFAQAINIFDGQVKYVVFLQLVHLPHGKYCQIDLLSGQIIFSLSFGGLI